MSGRKHSKKRDAILELIRASRAHPGAQWVYDRLRIQFPDLSLGTVYRNIKVLLEEGVLVSAGVVNGEERFDGEILPHSHAVCTHCGMIADLPTRETVPGFPIDIRNTVFYGLCNDCSKEIAALGR